MANMAQAIRMALHYGEENLGGPTTEMPPVTDEDSDWEALFEEAEQNVMKTLKAEDSNPEQERKPKKKK